MGHSAEEGLREAIESERDERRDVAEYKERFATSRALELEPKRARDSQPSATHLFRQACHSFALVCSQVVHYSSSPC